MYQCVAENRHGVIYANAELRVFGERVLPVGVRGTIMVMPSARQRNAPLFGRARFPGARRRTVIDLLITPAEPPSESLITLPLFLAREKHN